MVLPLTHVTLSVLLLATLQVSDLATGCMMQMLIRLDGSLNSRENIRRVLNADETQDIHLSHLDLEEIGRSILYVCTLSSD